jgi:uncharacterized protein (TIGR03435 family)
VRRAAIASVVLCVIAPAAAQQPAPAFEVASVKENRSRTAAWSMTAPPGGRFNFTNATLDTIIRWAYRLQDFQLAGAPDWTGSTRFDVVAKAGGSPPPDEMQLQGMMQTLLAEHFKLVSHMETRELPTYALMLVGREGKPGVNLHASPVDCAAVAAAARTGALRPPLPGGRPLCGIRMGAGTMTAGGITMARLVPDLSRLVNRVVVDRTGLAGAFDLDLRWTPESLSRDAQPSDPNAPSIFTAVQEQLGLKLEATKGPVEVLVIDHVEHPRED